MLKNLRKKKKGFTLIELIIVVAILAILAAVALPRLGNMTDKASKSADVASAKTIANTVSILIAEGKITTSSTVKDIIVAKKETYADNVSDKELKAIIDYLQTVPTSKLNNGANFTVKISDDKIEVVSGKYTFFPTDANGEPIITPAS